MMVISFGIVIYAIQTLRSKEFSEKASDPQSALGLLIGSDYRPLNWCPAGVKKVELFGADGALVRVVESAADLSAVCEIMMGAFSSEGIDEASYVKKLAAHGAPGGEIVLMEQVPGKPLFRVKGMPFSSPMLAKALERLTGP